MARLRIVGISGNVKAPSRTSTLVGTILDVIGERIEADVSQIDLVDAAPVLFRALRADQLDEQGQAIVRAVEGADALVVGSPVYRASYSGALKHLFDLVHYEALVGRPVLLAATGGTPLHGLMTEHQLRPLFGFFKALALPTAIYALEADFEAYRLANADIRRRVDLAVRELEALLPASRDLLSTRSPIPMPRLSA